MLLLSKTLPFLLSYSHRNQKLQHDAKKRWWRPWVPSVPPALPNLEINCRPEFRAGKGERGGGQREREKEKERERGNRAIIEKLLTYVARKTDLYYMKESVEEGK